MVYPIKIKALHEVHDVLTQKAARYLTPARMTLYEASLIRNLEVTVEVCQTLNPAMLLPELEREEREYSCFEVMEEELPLRKDLSDTEIENAELVLFVDRSSYVLNGL